MTAAEFEYWQAGLPTRCSDLKALLSALQAQWLHAQAALIPATRAGNGYAIQKAVTTLSRQVRVIEARLLASPPSCS